MLGHRDVAATIAVKDLQAARRWYEEKLGLSPIHTEGTEAVSYRTGNTQLLIYRSQFAGTNRATGATWMLNGDLDAAIKKLKSTGVTFERCEFPDVKHEGDVHVLGDTRAAWFKDPDGNILALVSGRTSDVHA
jgi:catechol 2,3-dioxygenase-like lactoylglutathione lyase family enzyme